MSMRRKVEWVEPIEGCGQRMSHRTRVGRKEGDKEGICLALAKRSMDVHMQPFQGVGDACGYIHYERVQWLCIECATKAGYIW